MSPVDYFALLIGIITAFLKSGFILLLSLGELGGPIDFGMPLLLLEGVPFALIAIF